MFFYGAYRKPKELGLSYKSPIPLRSFDFKNSKSCTFMLGSKFQVFANKGFLIINSPISPREILSAVRILSSDFRQIFKKPSALSLKLMKNGTIEDLVTLARTN